MLDDIRFSASGDVPTDFEVRLLMTAGPDNWPAQLAQRMAARLGPQLAVEMLALLLDELGNERVDVPTRCRFFRGLWCGERDRLIVELAQPGRDFRKSEIAEMLGVKRAHVSRVLKGRRAKVNPQGGQAPVRAGKPRP